MASQTEKKVLIAMDESEHSKRAFEYYLRNIAQKDKDVLILLHIFNPPPPPALSSKGKMSHMGMGMHGAEHTHPFGSDFFLSDPKSEHWIAWRKTVEDKVQELKTYLSVYEKQCVENQVKCHSILHSGNPGEAICEISEERDVSLVILGSRGLNKLRRTFLGSVSDYVIHHARKPVMVVPPQK